MNTNVTTKWIVRYWYKGAPKDRPGGPWWEKEFTTDFAAESFYRLIKDFCCEAERPREVPLTYEIRDLFKNVST